MFMENSVFELLLFFFQSFLWSGLLFGTETEITRTEFLGESYFVDLAPLECFGKRQTHKQRAYFPEILSLPLIRIGFRTPPSCP